MAKVTGSGSNMKFKPVNGRNKNLKMVLSNKKQSVPGFKTPSAKRSKSR